MAKQPATSPPPRVWPCLRLEIEGKRQRVVIDLSISPNAKRSEVVGWHDGALRLRIAASPIEGAANDAVRRWLSSSLGVPQANIELLRGATSRRKQWALDTDPARIYRWIDDLIASGQIPAPTL
ncbi:MAG: hypothetical protein C0487_07505 [Leptothrix sp. (in: Bacteria)]|nr:hypothetical protein [Leptothrix sp. (in: b-proteobacteria)]